MQTSTTKTSVLLYQLSAVFDEVLYYFGFGCPSTVCLSTIKLACLYSSGLGETRLIFASS